MKAELLITMGDVAGIGPEIIVKAWPELKRVCDPIIVGDEGHLRRAGGKASIRCVNPSPVDLDDVPRGEVNAAAGQAAYDWLHFAIRSCLDGRSEGIVTCPLHKEGLSAAGIDFPGHTEILAKFTKARRHAMLLYDDALPLAVAHVTLHVSVKDALAGITKKQVLAAIELLHGMVPKLTGQTANIGVLALNPHASDGGLFGDEETRIIRPAIAQAVKKGINVTGPIPADAAFLPQNRKTFNGLVAMLHDHGHIAMKLLGGRRAVNVTAGLPIVRTSVAHGTAYDIAGQGIADERSLIAAATVAARLVQEARKTQA